MKLQPLRDQSGYLLSRLLLLGIIIRFSGTIFIIRFFSSAILSGLFSIVVILTLLIFLLTWFSDVDQKPSFAVSDCVVILAL